jgi:hypothetical protein
MVACREAGEVGRADWVGCKLVAKGSEADESYVEDGIVLIGFARARDE